VAKHLVAAGASVICPNDDGMTSLQIASQHSNFIVASFILNAGAGVEWADKYGKTTLI
jgi:ankyrin repeat protein